MRATTAAAMTRMEELATLVNIYVRLGRESLRDVNKTAARVIVPLPANTIEWEVRQLEARFLKEGRWSYALGRLGDGDIWQFELQPYGDTPPLTLARMLFREVERADDDGYWLRKCGVRTPVLLTEDQRRETEEMLATRGWGNITLKERRHQFYGIPIYVYRMRRNPM